MYTLDVVTVLENLVKAVKTEDTVGIDSAIANAIHTLGYDPFHPEQEYLVTLEIGVMATNPDDAVREFQKLIGDPAHVEWVYKVTDENEVETEVDTYRWK